LREPPNDTPHTLAQTNPVIEIYCCNHEADHTFFIAGNVCYLDHVVAPFFDPKVGAMMGRVVPLNVDTNLLTRFLNMERSGGFQVDQQARMNMHLVPLYGGTVGGIRLSALKNVGG
jgi:hypothetical protein